MVLPLTPLRPITLNSTSGGKQAKRHGEKLDLEQESEAGHGGTHLQFQRFRGEGGSLGYSKIYLTVKGNEVERAGCLIFRSALPQDRTCSSSTMFRPRSCNPRGSIVCKRWL